MKKIKVIKNIPAKLPISSTILYSFLLNYYNVDNIWWGIFITLYSIYWIIIIVVLFMQERVDIFDADIKIPGKTTFAEKLKQMADDRKQSI